jgi:magnesium chelatase subunit D
VVLSDGRANLARDGSPGRPRAMEEAMAMARKLSLLAPHRLLIDTSARPEPAAVLLSQAMSAQYLALPMAGAKGIHKAIQSVRRAPTEA